MRKGASGGGKSKRSTRPVVLKSSARRRTQSSSGRLHAAYHRALFAHHPDGTALVDPTGRIVLSNTALGRLIGRMHDHLQGRSFADLLKLAEAARFRDILARALCGNGDSPNFVTQGNRLDGHPLDLSLTVIPAVIKGKISGGFVQVREIIRLPKEEREQRRTARLNRAILDSLPAHIALIDGSGRIVAVNEAWRRFARENGLRAEGAGVGTDYIEAWRTTTGLSAEGARLVAERR